MAAKKNLLHLQASVQHEEIGEFAVLQNRGPAMKD